MITRFSASLFFLIPSTCILHLNLSLLFFSFSFFFFFPIWCIRSNFITLVITFMICISWCYKLSLSSMLAVLYFQTFIASYFNIYHCFKFSIPKFSQWWISYLKSAPPLSDYNIFWWWVGSKTNFLILFNTLFRCVSVIVLKIKVISFIKSFLKFSCVTPSGWLLWN